MSGVKRVTVIFSVVLIAALMLPFSAFAAADDESGFSLWDLLDGLGGFFRDLINSVGQFFANLFRVIGDGISYILSGIKYLFIPSKESFASFRDDILDRFDNKFGSVFSALDYLKTRFQDLRAKDDLREIFKVTFPNSSFLSGLSIDFLSFSAPVLEFFRFCITGLCCFFTAMRCYNMAMRMVNT